MYCTDFICTYQNHKDEDEQEDIYRCQFLQAFELEEWDDAIINKMVSELFDKIKNNKEFEVIFEKLKISKENMFFILMMGDDKLTLFKLLFKFEFFYITHSILCSFFNKNIILEDSYKLYNF
jgi:hypothetical protein